MGPPQLTSVEQRETAGREGHFLEQQQPDMVEIPLPWSECCLSVASPFYTPSLVHDVCGGPLHLFLIVVWVLFLKEHLIMPTFVDLEVVCLPIKNVFIY